MVISGATPLAGAATGPWVTGVLHDIYGDYVIAFSVGIAMSVVGMLTIWLAGPGKIRVVAGQAHRVAGVRQDAAVSSTS